MENGLLEAPSRERPFFSRWAVSLWFEIVCVLYSFMGEVEFQIECDVSAGHSISDKILEFHIR